jgi:hypothetical protein
MCSRLGCTATPKPWKKVFGPEGAVLLSAPEAGVLVAAGSDHMIGLDADGRARINPGMEAVQRRLPVASWL